MTAYLIDQNLADIIKVLKYLYSKSFKSKSEYFIYKKSRIFYIKKFVKQSTYDFREIIRMQEQRKM